MDAKTNGVNGERKEWRDVTSAKLALLEPQKIEARKAIARRMLAQGATTTEIMKAARDEGGFGIGSGTICRLRKEMEREQKRAERKAAREKAAREKSVKAPKTVAAPPAKTEEWARLPADMAVIGAFVAARVPFVFDGERISVKGGGK